MFRGRKPAPAPGFSLLAIPGPPRDLLDYLGAVPFGEIGVPREGECFVYGLDNADGACFYIGSSESLYRRLGQWERTYKDYLAGIRVLRCESKDDMNKTEIFLIHRMQAQLVNVRGTVEEDNRRARALKAPRPYTSPVESRWRAGEVRRGAS